MACVPCALAINLSGKYSVHNLQYGPRTLYSLRPNVFFFILISFLVENYGNFTYLMNMYTDKENSKKVENFPLLVGISQRLYISLKVQSGDSDLSLFPDECKATPSTEYNAKPDHKIIEQG